MGGEAAAELIREPSPDVEQVNLLIGQIEIEFEAKLARRKELQEASLRDFEDKIERKRHEYQDVCKQIREVNTTCHE